MSLLGHDARVLTLGFVIKGVEPNQTDVVFGVITRAGNLLRALGCVFVMLLRMLAISGALFLARLDQSFGLGLYLCPALLCVVLTMLVQGLMSIAFFFLFYQMRRVFVGRKLVMLGRV